MISSPTRISDARKALQLPKVVLHAVCVTKNLTFPVRDVSSTKSTILRLSSWENATPAALYS